MGKNYVHEVIVIITVLVFFTIIIFSTPSQTAGLAIQPVPVTEPGLLNYAYNASVTPKPNPAQVNGCYPQGELTTQDPLYPMNCCLNDRTKQDARGRCRDFTHSSFVNPANPYGDYLPGSSRVTDGFQTIVYCSRESIRSPTANDWVYVNLGRPKEISKIYINQTPYSPNACAPALRYAIDISNSTTTWVNVKTATDTSANKAHIFSSPAVAQYIRFTTLQMPDVSGWRMGIREIQVLGPAPDLVVQGVVKTADNKFHVQIKNQGTGRIEPPNGSLQTGVCYSIYGTDSLGVHHYEEGCVNRENYPILPGRIVNDTLQAEYTGNIYIGIDGMFYDATSQPNSYKIDAELNMIQELNENNNYNTVTAPTAVTLMLTPAPSQQPKNKLQRDIESLDLTGITTPQQLKQRLIAKYPEYGPNAPCSTSIQTLDIACSGGTRLLEAIWKFEHQCPGGTTEATFYAKFRIYYHGTVGLGNMPPFKWIPGLKKLVFETTGYRNVVGQCGALAIGGFVPGAKIVLNLLGDIIEVFKPYEVDSLMPVWQSQLESTPSSDDEGIES